MLDVQQAQPSSDCGKSNFPTVDVQGPPSVYWTPVVDCKIPALVQRWVYNRSNLRPTVEKVIFRQWMYMVYTVCTYSFERSLNDDKIFFSIKKLIIIFIFRALQIYNRSTTIHYFLIFRTKN